MNKYEYEKQQADELIKKTRKVIQDNYKKEYYEGYGNGLLTATGSMALTFLVLFSWGRTPSFGSLFGILGMGLYYRFFRKVN